MKFRLFLLLPVIILQLNFSSAQDCELPKEVKLTESLNPKDGFPVEADGFFPIGWSQDGKFAYILRRNHDPAGEYMGFYIQDMVTDSVLEFWEHDTFEKGYEDPFQAGWDEQGAEICRLLNQHGIELGKPFKVQRGQGFRFGKVDFKHRLEQELNEENWSFISASLYVEKRGAGTKRIFHMEGEAAQNSLIKSLKVLGVSKSPFEERVVVILQSDDVGFEGYTDRTFRVVGCDLVKGFR